MSAETERREKGERESKKKTQRNKWRSRWGEQGIEIEKDEEGGNKTGKREIKDKQ